MLRQVKILFGAVVVVSLATTTYIVPTITEQAIAAGGTKTLATVGEPSRAQPARTVETVAPLPVRVINDAEAAKRAAALAVAMQERANRVLAESGEAPIAPAVVTNGAPVPHLGAITCIAGCN
jgi:hypothetical protein